MLNSFIRQIKKKVGSLGREKELAITTAELSGTITSIPIAGGWDGPALKSGTKVLINGTNGTGRLVTLSADLANKGTSITITSVTLDSPIPRFSYITMSDIEKLEIAAREYDNVHIHLYHTGGNNGNDYLPNFSQWNFNVNTAVILADGDSKPNRWSSQYSVYNAIEACTIESVKGYFSTDGGTNDDFDFTLWAKPVIAGGTSNTDLDLIQTWSFRSVNNQNHIFEADLTSAYSLAAGRVLIPTVKRSGSGITASSKIYGDIEIQLSYQK